MQGQRRALTQLVRLTPGFLKEVILRPFGGAFGQIIRIIRACGVELFAEPLLVTPVFEVRCFDLVGAKGRMI